MDANDLERLMQKNLTIPQFTYDPTFYHHATSTAVQSILILSCICALIVKAHVPVGHDLEVAESQRSQHVMYASAISL